MEKMGSEIDRLGRLDMRMNKEMVAKPYSYIDQVKKNIDKEQRDIVEIIKGNNEKYVTKIANMDHKVNKVLTHTETLLDQYRKKIGDINKNLESTKQFRTEIRGHLTAFEKSLVECEENCNSNHIKLGQHIDRVALKFAENTVDLTSASEGFQREIERVQTIFRDLASEYMTTLEEKK